MAEVQEIKVKAKAAGSTGDWSKTKALAEECERLALEIEGGLNDLSEKYKRLSEKAIQAYKAAPLTDVGYGVSPISGVRFLHAMKAHLFKNGLRLDQYNFGEARLIPEFSKAVKDSLKWLLKFS